jgi:hypothetical protein
MKLVLYDVAVDGKHAESNSVLARRQRVYSHGNSFSIIGADLDVAEIDTLAARVDHPER